MSQVFFSPAPDRDPELQAAIERARSTIRYFFRELVWESRRIVPGLDLACVKIPFQDPPSAKRPKSDEPSVEQMWINDVHFDGKLVHGTLINSPNWLTSVKEGDDVAVPIQGTCDWMYAIDGRVYGAYTVNLIRKRMSRGERKQHDDAWGLDFGDPDSIHVVPSHWSGQEAPQPGFFGKLFGSAPKIEPLDPEAFDHPMSINMAQSFRDHLKKRPQDAKQADAEGWTQLHDMAVAGSVEGTTILLQHGADPNAATKSGVTPLHVAKTLGWSKIVPLLAAKR